MTNQEESRLTAQRMVSAARHAAQSAAIAAQHANHTAHRLFLDALARPTCAATNKAARDAQIYAALAESAAEQSRQALYSALQAQRQLCASLAGLANHV